MTPSLHLTGRFVDAVRYAAVLHGAQGRKNTEVAYIGHLLGVASLVVEAGGDEDQVIAALLHDAAEDHGGEARLADIAARFWSRVADIVEGCSDSLTAQRTERDSYLPRKQRHLARLVDASRDVLLVNTADKVFNTRALVTDLQNQDAAAVLARYDGTPAQTLWYYEENLQIVLDRSDEVPAVLVTPLHDAVRRLRELLTEAGLVDAAGHQPPVPPRRPPLA